MENTNYYQILALKGDESSNVISEAINVRLRKVQSEKNHPKIEIRLKADFDQNELFRMRDILLTPEKRKSYDKSLLLQNNEPIKINTSNSPSTNMNSEPLPSLESKGLSIVLLMDVSGSMEGEKIKEAKESLISFINNVDLINNEIGLVTFGKEITTSKVLTQEINAMRDQINRMQANGTTPMLEGIKEAKEYLLKNAKGDPMLVIATDGLPDETEDAILDYVNSVKSNNFTIKSIGIGEDVNEDFLKRLASSENDYYFAQSSSQLQQVYTEIVTGLSLAKG